MLPPKMKISWSASKWMILIYTGSNFYYLPIYKNNISKHGSPTLWQLMNIYKTNPTTKPSAPTAVPARSNWAPPVGVTEATFPDGPVEEAGFEVFVDRLENSTILVWLLLEPAAVLLTPASDVTDDSYRAVFVSSGELLVVLLLPYPTSSSKRLPVRPLSSEK